MLASHFALCIDGKKLENVTTSDVTTPTEEKPGLVQRLKRINRLLAATVIIPTAIATLYFGVIASDVYVSESRFVVKSPQKQTQSSVVGAFLQGAGLSRSTDDTYSVIDYMASRDALRELNANNYIFDAYTKHGDFVSRFHTWPDNSFEELWKYYDKHVVTATLDSESGITKLQVRAYTAED
ncbi:MAG: hypothetical protein IOC32_34230, partial [Burkholderia sp.]|nr:hypothetical protein [Burkholderia sp.]